MTGAADTGADAYVLDVVRSWDRPRYVASLFAPARLRPDLLALYAMRVEVARIPDQVSEPGLGEIRLQWWREAIERLAWGGPGETPVLRGLGAAVERHRLPHEALLDLVEACRDDLYADPPASRGDLEAWLGRTQSSVFQLAALVLGSGGPESANAAGHAGLAYGLAFRLAGLAVERARGRWIAPADLLQERGLSPNQVFAKTPPPDLAEAVGELARLARHHLHLARAEVAGLAPALRPAFLPLAVVPALLDRIERSDRAILSETVALSPLSVVSRVTWAALTWRSGSKAAG